MRLSRILFRYVLREVLGYTALGFLVFVGILVVQNLLRRLEDLAAVGLRAGDVGAILLYLVPMLAAYAVPVAFLFGAIVAMGRLSTDAEVTAMRACGVGLRELLGPVLLIGGLVSVLTGFLLIDVEPRARGQLRAVLKDVASRGALLEAGKFHTLSGQRVVFVRSRDRENRLEQIFVDDRARPDQPFLIFAERGRFAFEPETAVIHLALENGAIHLQEPNGDDRYRRISFESFDYRIDASAWIDAGRVKPAQLRMSELREAARLAERGELPSDYREREPEPYLVQWHRRLALPVAPLLFGLVAVPLGLRRTRGARSWGTFLCIVLVFAYYVLLSLGQFLGEAGFVPAALSLWLPNAAFAAAAIPLLRRARLGGA